LPPSPLVAAPAAPPALAPPAPLVAAPPVPDVAALDVAVLDELEPDVVEPLAALVLVVVDPAEVVDPPADDVGGRSLESELHAAISRAAASAGESRIPPKL
jgi:hypothetical protein